MEQFFRQLVRTPVKHHQIDQQLMLQQEFAEGSHRDLQRPILREAVIIGGDQREGDGFTVMLQCQLNNS